MSSSHERRILEASLELPSAERRLFVRNACNGDAALEARVFALLDARERDRGDTAPGTHADPLADPETIGPYSIVERVGEGGMGVVYIAEQREPVRRRVAIKIIKLGMDTAEVIGRFESERQALALMNHPNIARILDAGATDQGRPYFVMEYVPGVSIVEFCDRARMSMGNRLRLYAQVCRAVEHANGRGVIHRDLKPSNILVVNEGGRPFAKIIDFGIAKATTRRLSEVTVYTELGRLLGTPEYMSPEQATGRDLDARSDVYSLGVVLYELLVGTKPFDFRDGSMGHAEIQRVICEVEPPPPSVRTTKLGESIEDVARVRGWTPNVMTRAIRGDLDWITSKALAKDRSRRYASAAHLADDIDRYLQDEPVKAGPPGAWYRVRKFAQRRRGVVTAAAVTLIAIILAVVVTARLARPRVEGRSVAVLPFDAPGAPGEMSTLADGLHESIITHLSKMADLSVISRASVIPYRDGELTVGQIGRELNVSTLLDGSVRQAGDQLRVTVQLVRASDGVQLWADQYDRPYRVEEVFAIQSDIAERIAEAMDATLLPAERERIRAEPTTSLAALEAFFRGNVHFAARYEEAEARRAVVSYEEAVELDAAFGVAHAALARARIWLVWQFADGDDQRAAAEAALERARVLAPDAFETIVAEGQVRYRADRDYETAMGYFQAAAELAPNDFEGHLAIGSIHRRLGEWDQAVAAYERAAALSPRDPTLLYTLAHSNHLRRDFATSKEWFERLAVISTRVGRQSPISGRFELYSSMGDTAAARALLRRVPIDSSEIRRRFVATLDFYARRFEDVLTANTSLHIMPLNSFDNRRLTNAMVYDLLGDERGKRIMADSVRLSLESEIGQPLGRHPNEMTRLYGRLALAHALLGNRDAALEAGELSLLALPLSADAYTGRFGVQRMALIHLYLGNADETIDILEQLLSIPSEVTPELLELDPRWDAIRDVPRFREIVESRTF